jgi:hypothetical protein
MSLQNEITEMINNDCGRRILVNRLNYLAKFAAKEDNFYFINAAQYIDRIYNGVVATGYDTVKYEYTILKSRAVFMETNEKLNCEILKFAVLLIDFRLKSVSDIKLLA